MLDCNKSGAGRTACTVPPPRVCRTARTVRQARPPRVEVVEERVEKVGALTFWGLRRFPGVLCQAKQRWFGRVLGSIAAVCERIWVARGGRLVRRVSGLRWKKWPVVDKLCHKMERSSSSVVYTGLGVTVRKFENSVRGLCSPQARFFFEYRIVPEHVYI